MAESTEGAPPLASGERADTYAMYERGLALLEAGSATEAADAFASALVADPTSRSLREALGRAQFVARRYEEAVTTFAWIVEGHPDDDYAHFALGLSAARAGRLDQAARHLSLAAAMSPDNGDYARALRGVRAAQARQG